MAKFKNIKKMDALSIAAAQVDFKVVKPLAGPVKEVKKPESMPKRSNESPKRVETKVVRSTRPKKIGTFAMILFVTVVLQVVLLVSLLYLSPNFLH